MPHGFSLDVDSADKMKFSKMHDNGEVTEVEGRKIPGENWQVDVRDPRGSVDLGTFGTKTDAKSAATRWMKDNPKGVGGQNQGVAGMDAGIPGMDGNGIF